jgi:hypothetical protein
VVNDADLRSAALRYAELGYRVFPCAANGKTPLTAHGFHDATTDAGQIERWWEQHPRANIGIATKGLLVLDLDGADNAWPGDPERSVELTCGPLALTANGGRHRLFKQPAGKNWRCTESRLAPKVDTRANGGYIVAPPSLLGPDKLYRWAPDCELDDPPDRLPEPPGWLAALLDALAHKTPTAAHGAASPAEGNAIPEGQRNATLAKLGGAMRRVGMSLPEILAALTRVNADRCRPPVADREVERIAASVARYDPDSVSVALVENHYDQMFAGAGAEPDADDPGPVPDELLRVPGFVDAVMRYTLDTAPYPEPVLAFAGALTLQALLAGRKVRDALDNRTNLYVLSLANSGVGKDHARKVNARILLEAGLADCLGTSFASGEGLEDRLFVQPASLFQVDEIDGLLLRVSQSRDARHEAIVSMLLQMYSSASTLYVMRAKAGQDRAVIDQPCLCLFGTAVPKHFYESLSARLMTNGFLARMLVLECRKRGEGREDTAQAVPEAVLDAARWWANFRPGGGAGNLADWHPVPRAVGQTDAARLAFRDLRERADAEYARCESANDPAGMAIWARAYEKVRRLALIYACSENRADPVIGDGAAAWAGAFVDHQTRRMLFMARQHASESDFDAKRKRLLEVLAKWREAEGDRWMPFWMINRKLPWTGREHEEVRDTLLHQRLIEYQVSKPGPKGGRPTAGYRLAAPPETDGGPGGEESLPFLPLLHPPTRARGGSREGE